MGFEQIDEELLDATVEFASFDNMKAMERGNRFDRKLLRPGDPGDPGSFKVRRGKVGGWVEYLSEEDTRLIEAAASKLRL